MSLPISPLNSRSNTTGRPSSRRLSFVQRRHLIELQLATRLAFLEARLDAFVQRTLGLSSDQTVTPPSTWPPPDPPKPLAPQEATEFIRIAGEYQRIRALSAIQQVQSAAAFAAGELRDSNVENKSNLSYDKQLSNETQTDRIESITQSPMLELTTTVLRQQKTLTEIPMLSNGHVGFWGERSLDSEAASSVYQTASTLYRIARECDILDGVKRQRLVSNVDETVIHPSEHGTTSVVMKTSLPSSDGVVLVKKDPMSISSYQVSNNGIELNIQQDLGPFFQERGSNPPTTNLNCVTQPHFNASEKSFQHIPEGPYLDRSDLQHQHFNQGQSTQIQPFSFSQAVLDPPSIQQTRPASIPTLETSSSTSLTSSLQSHPTNPPVPSSTPVFPPNHSSGDISLSTPSLLSPPPVQMSIPVHDSSLTNPHSINQSLKLPFSGHKKTFSSSSNRGTYARAQVLPRQSQ